MIASIEAKVQWFIKNLDSNASNRTRMTRVVRVFAGFSEFNLITYFLKETGSSHSPEFGFAHSPEFGFAHPPTGRLYDVGAPKT